MQENELDQSQKLQDDIQLWRQMSLEELEKLKIEDHIRAIEWYTLKNQR